MAAKETALNLAKYVDKAIHVKFSGGREVEGVLKGYDQLVNLVLDDTKEFLRDPEDPYTLTGATRQLGLTMCRGTTVMLIMPVDGTEVLHENPFLQAAGGQEEAMPSE